MDSLDAQCLVVDLLDRDAATPPLWRHDRDGSLHFRFPGSPRSFTWPPGHVAELAAAWHERAGPLAPPDAIAAYVAAHRRLGELLPDAGREPPDSIVHDLRAREVHAVWSAEKVVVILEVGRAS